MANVYADVRRGLVPTQDGARMVFMLDKMRSAVVADELEARVATLEERDREKTC